MLRNDILAFGTIVAASTIPAAPLTEGRLLAPLTILPASTLLAINSERVSTRLVLQKNYFQVISTMVEVFMPLNYFIGLDFEVRPPDDFDILVLKGSFNPIEDNRNTALCPPIRNGVNRDGTIVGLFVGDHDVFYNQQVGSPVLNQVRGQTIVGNVFTITNCNELDRT
jgi:hypothetical protein